MAKFTVAEFLRRLTDRFWKKGYERGLYFIRIFLFVTFIMVFIATLAECHPTDHYWQVVPDPGPQCRQGFAQLLTMGTTDIITDLLLVSFPIPIILRSSMRIGRKISLISLFSMSIILVAVTAARMPLVIQRKGLQQFRTVFASSEILAATFVSNFIILGSFLRDRGLKKQKFKAPSTENSLERGSSVRRLPPQSCPSDEHLARSLGYRTKPELVEPTSTAPRPAPVADLERLPSNTRGSIMSRASSWRFPEEELSIHRTTSVPGPAARGSEVRSSLPTARASRRVSWFDVGGLLDTSTVLPSPTDSVITHDFAGNQVRASRTSNATSSRASLTYARGALRPVQQLEDRELHNQLGQSSVLTEDHEQEEIQSITPQSNSSVTLQSQEAVSPLEHIAERASSEILAPLEDTTIHVPSHETTAPAESLSSRGDDSSLSISDPGGLLPPSSSSIPSPHTTPYSRSSS